MVRLASQNPFPIPKPKEADMTFGRLCIMTFVYFPALFVLMPFIWFVFLVLIVSYPFFIATKKVIEFFESFQSK